MDWIQQIGGVAAVLALLCATLWWLRRRGYTLPAAARRGGRRRMECVERVALGPQQALHLVRLGDRGLLIAASPAGCALLHETAWSEIAREAGE
jgi:flagellar biosynthetic protein FliO